MTMALQRIVPQRHGIIRTNMNRNHFWPHSLAKVQKAECHGGRMESTGWSHVRGGGAGCPGLWKAAVGGDRSSIGHEALGNVAKIFRRPICAPWFRWETHWLFFQEPSNSVTVYDQANNNKGRVPHGLLGIPALLDWGESCRVQKEPPRLQQLRARTLNPQENRWGGLTFGWWLEGRVPEGRQSARRCRFTQQWTWYARFLLPLVSAGFRQPNSFVQHLIQRCLHGRQSARLRRFTQQRTWSLYSASSGCLSMA